MGRKNPTKNKKVEPKTVVDPNSPFAVLQALK